jgi:hypothetical protein
MFRSPTAAADAATSRVGHPEEKVQRNLTRLLYGANGQSPAKGFALDILRDMEARSQEPEGRMSDGRLNRMGLPTQREQNSRYGPYNGN